MKNIKTILKNFFLIIIVLIIFLLYKEHEKNKINKINSFDFIVINLSIKNNDKNTLKYKLKKNNLFNKYISKLIFDNYNIKKNNIDYNLIFIKKNINKKNINKKINILKK